ncbi:holo-[acyl-carrier-protein] synthase [Amycolatopsis xylanica]|uniref:Holo-[acyl-carrier-protein] synthase n=1 Tax=Amycolatopsis xylanica TaxID=589385 RepID=A0A1H2U366_9PSEU|nr:holo-ACP synthase [Amycolatopsis xylanica]SDW50457.1 holo-[acyl-carrier-protein] synthase [Amycolatopsis xylanica]
MAMRVGVDLARVGELDRLLRRAWFRRYVYSAAELSKSEALSGPRAAEFLTGRFAAKEAVLKVLGTGILDGVAPREIEVHAEESGAPVTQLAGAALAVARRLGIVSVTVSIAHKQADVVAVAVGQLSQVGAELDALSPLDDPLLWAARCSLDAATLLLQAYANEDRETVLEAVAAARASVSAASGAASRTGDKA